MSVDPDTLLLDRVFQPAADRAAGWATCFDLARASLLAVLVLQTSVFAWNLVCLDDPLMLMLVTGGTLIGYGAASQMLRQVERAERQSRPGMMNRNRVLLRPFRLLWLAIATASAALLVTSALRPMDLCNTAVTMAWVTTVYFCSCAASPPRVRQARVGQLCPQGAG